MCIKPAAAANILAGNYANKVPVYWTLTLEQLKGHNKIAVQNCMTLLCCRWLKKEEYGKVPRYLQNIKVGLAKQHAEQQAAKEAAMIPPGMRMMPDDERLEMLGILEESRRDVEAKLQVLHHASLLMSCRFHALVQSRTTHVL